MMTWNENLKKLVQSTARVISRKIPWDCSLASEVRRQLIDSWAMALPRNRYTGLHWSLQFTIPNAIEAQKHYNNKTASWVSE
jgi:hypothetical protein